ncbi:MAG: hypothetical protein ACR2QC_02425 [Gammaproteobacteria bacterium]
MATACECVWEGSADVYIRPFQSATDGFIAMGNCESVTINKSFTEQRVLDNTSTVGGNCASYDRIDEISIEIECLDWCPENLRIAFGGGLTLTTVAAGTAIAAEQHTALLPATGTTFIKVNNIPDTTAAVTVTDNPVVNGPFVAGTDFTVSPGGILITKPASAILNNDVLDIGYTTKGETIIQGIIEIGREFSLILVGKNRAKANDYMIATVHRINFRASETITFVGNEPATFTLTGEVLSDATQAAGDSQYYTLQKAA